MFISIFLNSLNSYEVCVPFIQINVVGSCWRLVKMTVSLNSNLGRGNKDVELKN